MQKVSTLQDKKIVANLTDEISEAERHIAMAYGAVEMARCLSFGTDSDSIEPDVCKAFLDVISEHVIEAKNGLHEVLNTVIADERARPKPHSALTTTKKQ